MNTTELAVKFAQLHRRQKALEEQLENVKRAKQPVEAALLEQFQQQGVYSIKTDQGTVYLHHQIWANCIDPILLETTEWGYMVKPGVSTMSLSAAVRELPLGEDGMPELPEEIMKECINVTEKYSVRVKK